MYFHPYAGDVFLSLIISIQYSARFEICPYLMYKDHEEFDFKILKKR
jgi:hypothetical protein